MQNRISQVDIEKATAKKKTILHFIYDLGRGGAEIMLVRTLEELKEYRNIVVTIKNFDLFKSELICDKYICLDLDKILLFPLAVLKVKRIIKEYKVEMVHTHLFWPTIIGRFAVPRRIPLLTTIHTNIALSIEYKKRYIVLMDRLTYKIRKSIIISVSKVVEEEYFKFLKLNPYKCYVLNTFVDMKRFTIRKKNVNHNTYLILSTGALRVSKNQSYLIKAMEGIKRENIELHIYGEGPLKEELQSLIDNTRAKVVLKGLEKKIEEVFPLYDAFVMSSTFEGFSLAVLEAMASNTPLLLSNISSFKEQCNNTALYFDMANYNSFVGQLIYLKNNREKANDLAKNAFSRVKNLYTFPIYISKLRTIYEETFLISN